MKITKKQQEEIDFFSKHANVPFVPTQEEIEEYIKETVHGIKVKRENAWQSYNRISDSKRNFDITIPMWKEDLTRGMLGVEELREEFKDAPFGLKLVESVIKSITPKYRKEILEKSLKDNCHTILAFTNFPEVFKS